MRELIPLSTQPEGRVMALHETEGLLQAARAILGSTSLEEICQNLATHFSRLVDANGTVVYLVDHVERRVIFRLKDGESQPGEDLLDYEELDRGISGQVFQTKQPVLSLNADDGTEPEATRGRRRKAGVGALIVVPLVARDRVIGTATAINAVGQRTFSPHDVDLLMSMCTQAGVAIDNIRLLAESQQRIRQLESISTINKITSAELDEDRLFDLLYREAVHLVGIPEEKASFYLARYDTDRQELNFDLHYECGIKLPPINIKIGDGMTGWVVRHNRPLLMDDILTRQHDYGFVAVLTDQELETGRWARACLAVPLRLGQRVTGVMSVQSTDAGVFTDEHLMLLSMWASQIAVALENARLVDELKHRAEELQTRNEELDAFAHTVAHDIKNLVQASAASTTMLASRYKTLNEQQASSFLQALGRSNQKMISIIEELMLLSRVRQQNVEIEVLDMAQIVDEAQKRLAAVISTGRAEIKVPSHWPSALGHGAWVEEVWANYLSNAIKYGGEPPRLELGATILTDGHARFWVRDNGLGISPKEQSRLFKPFVRLSESPAEGHGLGLSIVRRIVEKLGGEVGVDSEEGQGSLFYFTLPLEA